MSTSFLPRFLHFLNRNGLLNIILVVTYFLLVVLPHNAFGGWLMTTFKPLGRDTFNLIIISIGGLGLMAYFGMIWNGIRKSRQREKEQLLSNRNRVIGFLIFTILLVLLVVNTLLVINTEIAHFIQYAILAILLFPLYWDYTATLFWAVMMGFWDEAYQYWVLNPQYNYFDFNDVILDLLGATLGLLLIAAYDVTNVKRKGQKQSFFKRLSNYFKRQPTVLWGLIAFILFPIIAYGLDWLVVFPQEGGVEAPIQLIRNYNPAFWQTVPKGFTFHVVKPLEGVLILTGLFIIYTGLGQYKFVDE